MKKTIGIIGERYEKFVPHIMLENSLDWLKDEYTYEYQWIETQRVLDDKRCLHNLSGIWSAPGSPFKSLSGVLYAIKYARENNIPHLGTCAGFQHTIIEFARNILGIKEAQHEEYEATSETLFINKLACSLSGKTMIVKIKENTLTHSIYKKNETIEDYYCNFGINPKFLDQLNNHNMTISGIDQDDEIRIIEYPQSRFFIATLFVPQSRSKKDNVHPLIRAFVSECIK